MSRIKKYLVPIALCMLAIAWSDTRAEAQGAPPDLVRTTDGAAYRGIVLEFVPNDYLVLLLPDGTRRRFYGTEVASVDMPPPPSVTPAPVAAPSVQGFSSTYGPSNGDRPVSLRVTSSMRDATLLRQAAFGSYSARFDRLCTAPCEAQVDRGRYTFVVEDGAGRQRAARPMWIDGDGELDIGIESRRPQRIRRWVAAILLTGTASALSVVGANNPKCSYDYYYGDGCRPNWAVLAPAMVMGTVGVGMIFGAAFTVDRGRVDFSPIDSMATR